MNCWCCASAIETKERVGFRECCPKCDRALHVCRNCGFYDPAYHNQCRETQAELVAEKERANFCEYFAPRAAGASLGRAPQAASSSAGAREKLEGLFRKR